MIGALIVDALVALDYVYPTILRGTEINFLKPSARKHETRLQSNNKTANQNRHFQALFSETPRSARRFSSLWKAKRASPPADSLTAIEASERADF